MSDTTSVGPPIQLPVLDISNPNDPAVGKAMLDAATKYGFLYVDSKGTDFTAEDVQRAFDQSKAFFASPAQDKETCRIQSNNRGWSGMHTETLDPEHQRTGDFKEAMNFGEFKDGKAQQPLPPSLAPQETQIGHFAELCNKTCARILKLLALGLQIPDDFFTSRHDSTQAQQAASSATYTTPPFPARKPPRQPGLEILTSHEEGTWAPVPVQPWASADASADEETSRTQHHHHAFPPPILVNIGDLLSYWTDGLLKSTVHRVVFPLSEQRSPSPSPSAEDRYSIAFFCHPLDATELVPVPSEVVRVYREERGERGLRPEEKVGFGGGAGGLEPGRRALTASEHLMSRLNATYSFREGGSSAAAAAAAV
ncbi:hypothetical protein AOCH_004393 [Aspergillus ochraceoroseus]|uniref:Fe2OG dioxygenase domain-containing protein n=1 Tax=Aspergillus ochraceoroseus TaxID=138278 RepID=A0A0F8XLR2_9EURO|nr:hypothetical protein AOCH_004393 [Aspergillus ochraceoroseus]